MRNYIKKMKEFVKLGFNDCSVDFKTREVGGKDIGEIIKLVEDYNEFNGKKVAKAIEKIIKVWDPHKELFFSFGREGSCVLYIDLPYWENDKKEKEQKTKLTLDLLKETKTDELWIEKGSGLVRAWWD